MELLSSEFVVRLDRRLQPQPPSMGRFRLHYCGPANQLTPRRSDPVWELNLHKPPKALRVHAWAMHAPRRAITSAPHTARGQTHEMRSVGLSLSLSIHIHLLVVSDSLTMAVADSRRTMYFMIDDDIYGYMSSFPLWITCLISGCESCRSLAILGLSQDSCKFSLPK